MLDKNPVFPNNYLKGQIQRNKLNRKSITMSNHDVDVIIFTTLLQLVTFVDNCHTTSN